MPAFPLMGLAPRCPFFCSLLVPLLPTSPHRTICSPRHKQLSTATRLLLLARVPGRRKAHARGASRLEVMDEGDDDAGQKCSCLSQSGVVALPTRLLLEEYP